MRLLSLTFLLLLNIALLTGQSNEIYVGANAGANFSKFKYTGGLSELYPISRSVLGLNGGVNFGIQIQNITISSGAQYIQKGGKYETDNFEGDQGTGYFTARERLHFVSIPLHIGYRKLLGDQLGLAVSLGPSFNLGAGGKLDEEVAYFGTEEVETTNHLVYFGNGVNDDYKGMQTSFQFSAGMFYDLNDRSRLTFNITWDSGMSDSFNPRYKNANSFFDDFRGNQLNKSTLFSIGFERRFSLGDRY